MRSERKDYRVQVKVKNANLLRAIESRGERPGQILAENIGIHYPTLASYISLKESPLKKNGSLKQSAEKICVYLNKMPSDLWSSDQLEAMKVNSGEVDVSFDEVQGMIQNSPCLQIEQSEIYGALEHLVGRLTDREQMIVRSYFAIGEQKKTLEEMGSEMGVSTDRVRQIKEKALRKMRHPYHQEKSGICEEDFDEYLINQNQG